MAREKQYAALPYRLDKSGRPEVLLITSRETRRWVVPKGWPMTDKLGHEAAAVEAYEEAGVRGIISEVAIGSFRYDKRLVDDDDIPCRVEVYRLMVEEELDRWPEMEERKRRWFRPKKAAKLVDEADLAKLILSEEAYKAAS